MSEIVAPVRRWHRPRPLPLFIVAGAVVVLLALGMWQVQRLFWKSGLISEIAAAAAQPPLELPKDEASLRALGFRRVALTGRFLNDREFHLAARYESGTLGYHVLTPFALTDGRIVLLNRGWVPLGKKEAAHRLDGQLEGERTLTAMVRADADRNPFTPEAEPEKNIWFYKDIAGMRRVSGLPIEPVPLDVLAGPTPGVAPPGGYPKPFDGKITLRNDHLGYALTWFSLAVAAAVIFVLLHWRAERQAPSANRPLRVAYPSRLETPNE